MAHDARTGVERWRHEDSAPGPSEPVGSWSFGTAGDVVAYSDGDRLTVLSATGAVVRTDLPNPRARSLATDAGTGLPALPALSIDGQETTETTTLLARDADPARDRVLLGRIVDLTVDDGSLPGLVLTARDKLYAWDVETGAPRWDRDLPAGNDALVVRGRVYLCSGTSIVALDAPFGGGGLGGRRSVVLVLGARDRRAGHPGDGAHHLARAGRHDGVRLRDRRADQTLRFPEGVVERRDVQEELLGYSRTFEEVAVLR